MLIYKNVPFILRECVYPSDVVTKRDPRHLFSFELLVLDVGLMCVCGFHDSLLRSGCVHIRDVVCHNGFSVCERKMCCVSRWIDKTARNMGMKGRLVCGAVSACAASSCARVRGLGWTSFSCWGSPQLSISHFFCRESRRVGDITHDVHPIQPSPFLLPDLCEKKKNMGEKKRPVTFFASFGIGISRDCFVGANKIGGFWPFGGQKGLAKVMRISLVVDKIMFVVRLFLTFNKIAPVLVDAV